MRGTPGMVAVGIRELIGAGAGVVVLSPVHDVVGRQAVPLELLQ